MSGRPLSETFSTRFPPRKLADIILPDLIRVSKSEHAIETNSKDLDQDEDIEIFKTFSYFVIKCEFSVVPSNWAMIQSVGLRLNIKNMDKKKTTVHMSQIFPRDEIKLIGNVAKEYQIMADLSLKSSEVSIPPIGVALPISANASLHSKQLRRIQYPLVIPKVLAGTAGNNEAQWKFYGTEALKPHGQYRVDMVVGFPLRASKNYRINLTLSAEISYAIDPGTIQHTVPIEFVR